MTFLRRAAGRTLRGRVRSSVTQLELEIKLLLLNSATLTPPRGNVPGMFHHGGGPGEDPGHTGGHTSLGWPGNASGSHQIGGAGEATGAREVWVSLLLSRDPTTDKRRWMDGWMEWNGATPAIQFSMFWP